MWQIPAEPAPQGQIWGRKPNMLIFHRFFKVFGPPLGLSVEDSEVDSGLNSGVGFKNIDFDRFFNVFGPSDSP